MDGDGDWMCAIGQTKADVRGTDGAGLFSANLHSPEL